MFFPAQAFTDPTTGIRSSSRLTLDHFREIYPRFPKIEVSWYHIYSCVCLITLNSFNSGNTPCLCATVNIIVFGNGVWNVRIRHLQTGRIKMIAQYFKVLKNWL